MDEAALRQLVDRYFAGSLDAAASRVMFEALDAHPAVSDYFAERQSFAALDPKGVGELDRIGRSLGLTQRPSTLRRWAFPSMALAAAAVVVVLAVQPPASDDGFAARGPEAAASVNAFTARGVQLAGTLAAGAELMFNYQTDRAGYLSIFAVDEGGRVFWYAPEWTSASDNPTAIAIAPSDRPIELPEAVRHELRAGPLRVFAVLLSRPMHVREIEAALPPHAVDTEHLPFGEVLKSWRVEVR
jgi:hypothetical protein